MLPTSAHAPGRQRDLGSLDRNLDSRNSAAARRLLPHTTWSRTAWRMPNQHQLPFTESQMLACRTRVGGVL